MLSSRMQKLLLRLYLHLVDGGIKSDFRDLYTNQMSYTRAVKYLEASRLIKTKNSKRKTYLRGTKPNCWVLTRRGEILARVLCGLEGMPSEIKKKQFVIGEKLVY